MSLVLTVNLLYRLSGSYNFVYMFVYSMMLVYEVSKDALYEIYMYIIMFIYTSIIAKVKTKKIYSIFTCNDI